MENDNKGNQSAGNGGQSQGKKQAGGSASALKLLQPHDMSKTVESAMHVFQGKHDKLPELLHDVGKLVLQGARRMSTTQLILTAGAVTLGAVLVAKYVSEGDFDFEE
ncbi:hypothetical protein H9Q13_10905 [Pontibacter sp. JH31]|uniref:Uncharacterized protein n=1 Tax=Pontibacter aquaedesilientis TaxID=2766980 RepID=A0ABR7XHA8_9BACT|nr:hypothetical protein [Pontibacter aquaedesilientis]MBD1397675.1 hypothetical protein [Pontibacter aquaedesilientis]